MSTATRTAPTTEVLTAFGFSVQHAAAREAAANGYEVLPLQGKRPAPCLPRMPKGQGGVKLATTDVATIDAWWLQGDWNIGLRVPEGQLVLDIDPRHGGEASLIRLEETYGPLPRTRTTVTGRGDGGEHIWLAGDGASLSISKADYPGIDLRRRGNFLVGPGSVHPETGKPYRWADVETLAPAPAWLAEAFAPTADDTTTASRARREISPRGRDMLRTGRKLKGDTSASGVAWSCLWFCAAAGRTPNEVRALAEDPTNRGLAPYVAKRGVAFLLAQYAYVLSLGGHATLLADLERVEGQYATHAWKGQTGTTARLLLEVLVEAATAARSLDAFRLTVPQAMTALNIPRPATVRSAFAYLRDAGMLAEVAQPDHQGGKTYRLVVPSATAQGAAGESLDRAHDAWTRAGLGKTALVVCRALATIKMGTAADVSAASGKPASTTYRALAQAVTVGLAARDGATYRWLGGEDQAADALGATGQAARTATAVADLRQRQADALQARREARDTTARLAYDVRTAGEQQDDAVAAVWEARGYDVLDNGDIFDPRTWAKVGHIRDGVGA